MDRPLNSHGFILCHTVSLPSSRSHGGFFIFHAFTNFERIFSQTHSFLKKQTQTAHSNANKERISSMINKESKYSQFSTLSWALLFIMLVKAHIGAPFQWKTQSDLLKIGKKFTAKYNISHSSK